jgi:hypothetical protein
MYQRFQNSPYNRMLAKGEPHWGLAHQDFGWSNGQMGPGGIWVIDLDGVSYDLPIRDLRKLITSTMDDMGVWDLTWIRGMIDAYHRANPLDQETFEILWIDMAFPNEFYKHVKEIVFNPQVFLETDLAPILQRVMTTESSKWQALAELEKDKANYPAGDYSADYVKPSIDRQAVVVPGATLTPIYADAPVTPVVPSTPEIPVTPVVEEIMPITLEPEPAYAELPTLVTLPSVEEPVYAELPAFVTLPAVEKSVDAEKPFEEAIIPVPFTPEQVPVTIPSTRKPKRVYTDVPAKDVPISVPVTPAKAGPISLPVTPEPVYAGDPAAITVPPMPAAPVPALIQVPSRGQKKFKLRVPRKRRAVKKTKIIKKTRYLKRRKLKRLTKWKRVPDIQIIWGYRIWRAKKKLRSLLGPKKKQLKRKLGLKKPIKRVVKPYPKKMQQPLRNKNVPPPWKKRQIPSRKRTA